MKIKFLGAAGTVTGSSYVLTSGSGQSILIDLGMFQGAADVDALNWREYEYDCSQLSAAILTHAHLDHCGRLPLLLRKGYTGSVWMTSATADLTELSLFDSAKIAKEDGRPDYFDKNLVFDTVGCFKRMHYRTPETIGDFIITMRDAGHILGSATIEVEDTNPDSDIRKIVFSGDLGNSPDELLPDIEYVESADAVVMESTYGDRLHPEGVPAEALQKEINAVEEIGGTLLIPSFSLHRTQEVMHMVKHLKLENKVRRETPVFMDSPMANIATEIYGKYPMDFNAHVKQESSGDNPFFFPGCVVIHNHKGQKLLDAAMGAKVIVAGSGMMTGGKIVMHAKKYLKIPATRLFIIGYQGEETLGRRLLEGDKTVTIEDEPVRVKATVSDTQTMSSHADQGQLMKWLKAIKGVKKVFLTHGEDGPRTALAEKIATELGLTDISRPKLNEEAVI